MPLNRNFSFDFFEDRSDFGLATVVNFVEEALKVTGNGAAVKNIYVLHNAPLHLFVVQTAILRRFIFLVQPI